MLKRLLDSALRARTYWNQQREMFLMVLTLNIMILAALILKLFYGAGCELFRFATLSEMEGFSLTDPIWRDVQGKQRVILT